MKKQIAPVKQETFHKVAEMISMVESPMNKYEREIQNHDQELIIKKFPQFFTKKEIQNFKDEQEAKSLQRLKTNVIKMYEQFLDPDDPYFKKLEYKQRISKRASSYGFKKLKINKKDLSPTQVYEEYIKNLIKHGDPDLKAVARLEEIKKQKNITHPEELYEDAKVNWEGFMKRFRELKKNCQNQTLTQKNFTEFSVTNERSSSESLTESIQLNQMVKLEEEDEPSEIKSIIKELKKLDVFKFLERELPFENQLRLGTTIGSQSVDNQLIQMLNNLDDVYSEKREKELKMTLADKKRKLNRQQTKVVKDMISKRAIDANRRFGRTTSKFMIKETEKHFSSYLNKKNEAKDCYDKFGRTIDPKLEEMKAKMIWPRRDFKYSSGAQKVYEKLVKMRNGDIPDYNLERNQLYPNDSLIESAFDSSKNDRVQVKLFNNNRALDWTRIQNSYAEPRPSEISEEQFLAVNANSINDPSISHDKMSHFCESGSSISSNFSDLSPNGENSSISLCSSFFCEDHATNDQCFYMIVDGLRLPMLIGEKDRKYTIDDIINISIKSMAKYKETRTKKISIRLIDKIIRIYQKEFGAPPLDLIKGFQISGHLCFKDYPLSTAQLNAVAVTIPYVFNLRYINLENCDLHDEQAAYVIKATLGLSRLEQLYLGKNQIGRQFIQSFDNSRDLRNKLRILSLSRMIKSEPFIPIILNGLKNFEKLKTIDIQGNIINNESAKALCHIIEQTMTLQYLNMSSCLKNSEAIRKILISLTQNQTIMYLNMSNNHFKNIDKEFGSRLGRLIQLQRKLVHLDISQCQLSREEVIYIAMRLKDSRGLQAIHLGYNNMSMADRILLRIAIKAQIKHPLRAQIQIHKFIKTAEDKNQVVILNSFIMSAMPPDNIDQNLTPNNTLITSIKDLKERITESAKFHGIKSKKNEFDQKELKEFDVVKKMVSELILKKQQPKEILEKTKSFIDHDEKLEQYFTEQKGRIYDMINFLDIYGRKYRFINIDNPKFSYHDIINQLTVEIGGVPRVPIEFGKKGELTNEILNDINQSSYIKMQKIQLAQKKEDPIQDIKNQRRETKLYKDLDLLLAQCGIEGQDQQDEIKTLFQWSYLFNDIYGAEKVSQNVQQDFVLSRVLNQAGMSNHWQDCSECWICKRHNRVDIHMNKTDEADDQDFIELTHLSTVFGDIQDQLDQKHIIDDNLFPIVEQVMEEADALTKEQMKQTRIRENEKRKYMKQQMTKDFKIIVDNSSSEDDCKDSSNDGDQTFTNQEDESICITKSLSDKNQMGTQCQNLINIRESINSQNYKFDKYQSGKNIVPLFSKRNCGDSREIFARQALVQNIVLNHQQISAAPITAKDFQKLASGQDETIQFITNKAEKDGIVYRNMTVNQEQLEYSISSEDDELNQILSKNSDSDQNQEDVTSTFFLQQRQTETHFKSVSPTKRYLAEKQRPKSTVVGRKGGTANNSIIRNAQKIDTSNFLLTQHSNQHMTTTMGDVLKTTKASTKHEIVKSSLESSQLFKKFNAIEETRFSLIKSSLNSNSFKGETTSLQQQANKNDFKTLQEIKEEMDKKAYINKQQQKIIENNNIAQFKDNYFKEKGDNYRFLKPIDKLEGYHPDKSVFEALTKQITMHWKQLRKRKDQEKNTMYLIASFNHWFPINMRNSFVDQQKVQQIKDEIFKKLELKILQVMKEANLNLLKRTIRQKLTNGKDNESSVNSFKTDQEDKDNENQIQRIKTSLRQNTIQNNEEQGPQKEQFGLVRRRTSRDMMFKTKQKIYHKELQKIIDDESLDSFKFVDFVPPGKHYFYFVKDGKMYSLSKHYKIEEYPGTNLRMNVIDVETRDWNIY